MKIGILGSGVVGQTLGGKLVERGEDVVLGTRSPGNDAAAKARVTELLKQWFGWRNVIDLGDITTARGAEMLLPIWVRLMGALGTPMFNFKIAR